ncbi:MAG: DUF6600 domain-containing protein [Steroidobacteraceae bacterium]
MKTPLILRVRALALAAVLSFPLLQAAAAQEVAEGEDPPDRVARLSYRQGDVSLEEAGSEERATAPLNRPLTTGDRLWADQDARAELQVGSAALHLDEYTAIELKDLGSDSLRVALDEGVLTVHVRDVGREETIEIDTPNAVVSLLEPGEYTIEVNRGGDTTVVKVREGASTVDSGERGARTYHIDSGRQGIFTGKDRLSAAIDSVERRSGFEQWADDREDRVRRAASTRYVSREVIGYEDLDEYGDWRSSPEYGYVWYPRSIAVGWAPYRYGHWAWVRPWGWTWMDDAPWGFAPFHYGRWAFVGSRWGWVPGPRSIRPVYAPALVAWVGGPSVSVSVSLGGGVGWFPLGPREVYVPGYRASRRHINDVNISNTVIVNNNYITNVYESRGRNERYVHQGRGDAVTVVSREDFTRGRPVDRNQIRWNDRDRGVIETNTLSPERDPGAVRDRDPGRVSTTPGLQRGRNVVTRDGRADRDAAPERETRRQSSGEPPSIVDSERRRGRLERDNGRADAEAPPRVIGRQNIGRPSASSEKQERSRVESPAGGREPVYREPSAPSLERRVPRAESRIDRPQEEVRAPARRIDSPPVYREERGRSIESQGAPAPAQSAPAREPTRQIEPRGGGNEGGERRGRQNGQGEDGDRKGRR